MRRVLLAAIFTLCVSCKTILGPDASVTPIAIFDQVWHDLDLHYSLFVVKQINWDSIGAVYRPRALNTATGNDISGVIDGMLHELHDDHVLFNGNRVNGLYVPRVVPRLGGSPVNVAYVAHRKTLPGGVSCGLVSPTIGYISLSSFSGNGWLWSIDSAIALLGPVKVVIVDVRNNQGGFLENATSAAGRFADQKTTVAYVRYRNGPAHTDFTRPIAQIVVPEGSHRFTGTVVLLTNRNTISAGELFVLAMRGLGRTTVVGDTTLGETGSPFARELQNGWTYQFPESIEFTLDGRSFENIGLPPDVPVQGNGDDPFEVAPDAQMERAISVAKRKAP
jgi:hypothetical protein